MRISGSLQFTGVKQGAPSNRVPLRLMALLVSPLIRWIRQDGREASTDEAQRGDRAFFLALDGSSCLPRHRTFYLVPPPNPVAQRRQPSICISIFIAITALIFNSILISSLTSSSLILLSLCSTHLHLSLTTSSPFIGRRLLCYSRRNHPQHCPAALANSSSSCSTT